MAIATQFRCSSCSLEIVAWSDGNPYYIDEGGEKKYAYHPDERVQLCTGNDVPNTCLACAAQVEIDSHFPHRMCPQCAQQTLVETTELDGRQCPRCNNGRFLKSPHFQIIS